MGGYLSAFQALSLFLGPSTVVNFFVFCKIHHIFQNLILFLAQEMEFLCVIDTGHAFYAFLTPDIL